MAHERVYHLETNEPFDVPASKASELRLQHGWTSTPWTREEVVVQPVEDEAPRGRGRRRRAVEDEAPILHDAGPAPFNFDEDESAGEDWRA